MTSGATLDSSGFDELEDLLKQYDLKMTDTGVTDILEAGAKEFTQDLLKLPKPMSQTRSPGYTHLVRSFAYKKYTKSQEVEVGWGKYYGPMVERGTKKMKARAHMVPLYNANKSKYEKTMVNAFF
jgi:HK97 gp10 family phage protein